MTLYICEMCGEWKQVSSALTIAADGHANQAHYAEIKKSRGEACPSGCGLMVRVKSTDKLCIVEKIQRFSD